MFVWERMTRNAITVGPEDSLAIAAQKLSEGKFRRLPVIEDGELVGILSEYDLEAYRNSLLWTSVREVMTPDPIVVEPSATLDYAAGLIASHRVGALPVMSCGKLVGIISARDMLLPEPRPLSKWVPH